MTKLFEMAVAQLHRLIFRHPDTAFSTIYKLYAALIPVLDLSARLFCVFDHSGHADNTGDLLTVTYRRQPEQDKRYK